MKCEIAIPCCGSPKLTPSVFLTTCSHLTLVHPVSSFPWVHSIRIYSSILNLIMTNKLSIATAQGSALPLTNTTPFYFSPEVDQHQQLTMLLLLSYFPLPCSFVSSSSILNSMFNYKPCIYLDFLCTLSFHWIYNNLEYIQLFVCSIWTWANVVGGKHVMPLTSLILKSWPWIWSNFCIEKQFLPSAMVKSHSCGFASQSVTLSSHTALPHNSFFFL